MRQKKEKGDRGRRSECWRYSWLKDGGKARGTPRGGRERVKPGKIGDGKGISTKLMWPLSRASMREREKEKRKKKKRRRGWERGYLYSFLSRLNLSEKWEYALWFAQFGQLTSYGNIKELAWPNLLFIPLSCPLGAVPVLCLCYDTWGRLGGYMEGSRSREMSLVKCWIRILILDEVRGINM